MRQFVEKFGAEAGVVAERAAIEQDLDLGESGPPTFRTKLRVSFKYEGGD